MSDNNQAKYFSEEDIEEFRDCFSLFTRNRNISSIEILSTVMRSLGFSPTIVELNDYYELHKNKEHGIDFATFLDVMHKHSEKERCLQDVTDAFKAFTSHNGVAGDGTINISELANILTQFGEQLTKEEVNRVFREGNLSGNVTHKNFLESIIRSIS